MLPRVGHSLVIEEAPISSHLHSFRRYTSFQKSVKQLVGYRSV